MPPSAPSAKPPRGPLGSDRRGTSRAVPRALAGSGCGRPRARARRNARPAASTVTARPRRTRRRAAARATAPVSTARTSSCREEASARIAPTARQRSRRTLPSRRVVQTTGAGAHLPHTRPDASATRWRPRRGRRPRTSGACPRRRRRRVRTRSEATRVRRRAGATAWGPRTRFPGPRTRAVSMRFWGPFLPFPRHPTPRAS